MATFDKILCIDVGRGTQDILLYDRRKKIENCLTLVLPSLAEVNARKLKKAVSQGKNPFFYGVNMGGFPLFNLTADHLRNGGRIYATRSSAVTFNDHLEESVEKGLVLVDDDWMGAKDEVYPIETKDIDLPLLEMILEPFEEGFDLVACAVQDHGAAPRGFSDRRFRMENYRKILDSRTPLSRMGFWKGEIPEYFTRMLAVESLIEGNSFFMDTGLAAVLGCLEDETVAAKEEKIIINVGNGHTLAAYLTGEEIIGLWEHHTGKLTAEKIDYYLAQLASGTVKDKEVFDDHGHGAYLAFKFSGKKVFTAVTGPNREILKGRGYYFACPHGNMMLSGAYGLMRACL
ncbi:MAG: DUF1786 family protein, partial [bacterium]